MGFSLQHNFWVLEEYFIVWSFDMERLTARKKTKGIANNLLRIGVSICNSVRGSYEQYHRRSNKNGSKVPRSILRHLPAMKRRADGEEDDCKRGYRDMRSVAMIKTQPWSAGETAHIPLGAETYP